MYINIYIYIYIYICRSETLGKDRCTASTDNGKDRCTVDLVIVQLAVQLSSLILVKIVVQ